MALLSDGEYLLLMNLSPWSGPPDPCGPLREDELARLRDVGVRTVLNYHYWMMGDAALRYVDERVAEAQRLGMRCVIASYQFPPATLPTTMYAQTRQGTVLRHVLSLWDEGARAAVLDGYRNAIARWGGPDVLIIHSGYLSGESVLHNEPCFYDPAARASHEADCGGEPDIHRPETVDWLRRSVVRWYMDIDAVLVEQPWRAVVNCLQWLIAQQSVSNGNFAQQDILFSERQAWPDADVVLLQYTYFAHGEPYPTLIKEWTERYRLSTIVEAQYCQGLEVTTPLAIERGFRGQIVAPIHPWSGARRLEDWNVDAIARSHRAWDAARGSRRSQCS